MARLLEMVVYLELSWVGLVGSPFVLVFDLPLVEEFVVVEEVVEEIIFVEEVAQEFVSMEEVTMEFVSKEEVSLGSVFVEVEVMEFVVVE